MIRQTQGFLAVVGCRGFLAQGGNPLSAVLTNGSAEKAAGDRIRIYCDFGDEPLLAAGYAISAKTITTSGTGPPTITGVQEDTAYQISGLFTGGTAGSTYDVVFTITLNDPDATIISRTGTLKVI